MNPVDRRIDGHRRDVRKSKRRMAETTGEAIGEMMLEGTTKAKREELMDLMKKIMDLHDDLLGRIDDLDIALTVIKNSINRRHQ